LATPGGAGRLAIGRDNLVARSDQGVKRCDRKIRRPHEGNFHAARPFLAFFSSIARFNGLRRSKNSLPSR
jgi:hypothetical protein